MTTKRMGEENFRWFVATVEDVNDPQKLGRVKIRVINEHDDPSITVEDLSWATLIQPPTSAAFNSIGTSPTGITVGSHVFGFFMDGHEKQLPLIWGTYAKMPDGTQASNDIPALAREINNLNKTVVGPEPGSAYAAKYPYNTVTQTRAGHVIEIDDTPTAERLHVYHKSGSYVEINKDGNMVTKVVGKGFDITVQDQTVYVGGTCNIQIVGDANIQVGGKVTAKASSWNITGNVQLNGSLNATGDVVAAGVSLDKHTHGGVQSGGSRTTGPQ